MINFSNEFNWSEVFNLFNFAVKNNIMIKDDRATIMYGRTDDSKEIQSINIIKNYDGSAHQEIVISKGQLTCYPDSAHVDELKSVLKDVISEIKNNWQPFIDMKYFD